MHTVFKTLDKPQLCIIIHIPRFIKNQKKRKSSIFLRPIEFFKTFRIRFSSCNIFRSISDATTNFYTFHVWLSVLMLSNEIKAEESMKGKKSISRYFPGFFNSPQKKGYIFFLYLFFGKLTKTHLENLITVENSVFSSAFFSPDFFLFIYSLMFL